MRTNNDNAGAGGKPGAYLSSLAVIALSFGYAVGWGAFVMPGTDFLPNAGPVGTIVGLLVGTVAVVVLAYNYHRATVGVSNLGAAVAYGYISAVAFKLLRQEPGGGRPAAKVAAVFGIAMSALFSLLMLVPDYFSASSLSTGAYLLLAIWCFAGFATYRYAPFARMENWRSSRSMW